MIKLKVQILNLTRVQKLFKEFKHSLSLSNKPCVCIPPPVDIPPINC